MPFGTSTMKATMPIISSGADSPSARAMPMMVPVSMPGMASGSTWCMTIWIFEAPMPSAASRIDGGTAFSAAREAMMMVGSVSSVSTIAPTSGAERGKPKKPMNTARPSNPKTMDGTAARLLMLTSMRSVQRLRAREFLEIDGGGHADGERQQRASATSVKNDPTTAPQMPALLRLARIAAGEEAAC